MQTTRSAKLVLSALILACLVLSVVPGTSDAHRYLRMGWPQEPEDPDFEPSSSAPHQWEPDERVTKTSFDKLEVEGGQSIVVWWIRESLQLVWAG